MYSPHGTIISVTIATTNCRHIEFANAISIDILKTICENGIETLPKGIRSAGVFSVRSVEVVFAEIIILDQLHNDEY